MASWRVNVSRASSDALDALHAAVAASLAEALKGDEPDLKAIAVAIKFLKDNGIDAPATSPRFNALLDTLKDLRVDEIGAA